MPSRNDRRDFFKNAAAISTVGLSYWSGVASASRADTATESPNERIVWGALGIGDRWAALKTAEYLNGVGGHAKRFGDFAAISDVDTRRMDRVHPLCESDPAKYIDYRRVLDREDIDAVTIVTPDHWHAKMALEAMAAGKDVYCEKPLTLTIEEGQKICQAVKKTGRVFQVGTQQRTEFGRRFMTAVAIAHSGRLGKIRSVTVAIGGGPADGNFPAIATPAGFDWEKWLGPAPLAGYRELHVEGRGRPHTNGHYDFRWWYEYSGGKMTDWGAHHVDIAQWAMGLDHTSPVLIQPQEVQFPVEFKDGYPVRGDGYNTAVKFRVRCEYANGSELIIRHSAGDLGFGNGIMINGEKGRIFVNRGKLTGAAVDELKTNPLPGDALAKLNKGKLAPSHMGNFVECIKTRKEPVSDVFSHHKTMTTCHLANIALRLGRDLKWDPEKELMIGDAQANDFVGRTPRAGYEYPTV